MSKLAIYGGEPVRSKPFSKWPQVSEADVEAVSEVVRSGRWGRLGDGGKVREFEQKFAKYQGSRYGLGVATGTAALEVALRAAGIGPGDEVIVPPYTFMATATSVLTVGAVPIFADIDLETSNIDPGEIEKAITSRTRAVIPVHFGGLACDMDRILEIARRHKLWVIEDTAHGHGGKWKDKGLGTIGDLGAFSFQASKNLTSGEGGAVLTNDEKLYYTSVLYHDFWRGALRLDSFDEEMPGWLKRFPVLSWNYRLTEMQGALLLSQLGRLEEQAQTRANNGAFLDEQLGRLAGIRPMRADPYVTRNAYHIYMFRYTGEGFDGLSRDKFIEALTAEGIPCSGGYLAPIYEHPIFLDWETSLVKGFPLSASEYSRPIEYSALETPKTRQLCKEAVWFSQSLLLGSKADMQDVVEAVRKIQENVGELVA